MYRPSVGSCALKVATGNEYGEFDELPRILSGDSISGWVGCSGREALDEETWNMTQQFLSGTLELLNIHASNILLILVLSLDWALLIHRFTYYVKEYLKKNSFGLGIWSLWCFIETLPSTHVHIYIVTIMSKFWHTHTFSILYNIFIPLTFKHYLASFMPITCSNK